MAGSFWLRERENFIYTLAKQDVALEDIRLLLRYADNMAQDWAGGRDTDRWLVAVADLTSKYPNLTAVYDHEPPSTFAINGIAVPARSYKQNAPPAPAIT